MTKLRWVAEHEPRRPTASRRLPAARLADAAPARRRGLTTDRGDASGTGYWSPTDGAYRPDLLERAFGRDLDAAAGRRALRIGRRAVDARLGRRARCRCSPPARATTWPQRSASAHGPATSSSRWARRHGRSRSSDGADRRRRGAVAGFADATGRFLPLVCTLNAAQVLDVARGMLGVDHDGASRLALSAPAGAGGLVLLPYLDGERTPNRPDATGALRGADAGNATPANLARAAVEGMLCGLADAARRARGAGRAGRAGAPDRRRRARRRRVRRGRAGNVRRPVLVPTPGEYVADGAARQAALACWSGGRRRLARGVGPLGRGRRHPPRPRGLRGPARGDGALTGPCRPPPGTSLAGPRRTTGSSLPPGAVTGNDEGRRSCERRPSCWRPRPGSNRRPPP